MKFKLLMTIVIASAFATVGFSAGMSLPFSGKVDVQYAKQLWKKMEAKGLNNTPSHLYVGAPPHGQVREVLESKIDGKRVIIKRNYYGKGITVDAVSKNRAKYLKSITVMIKRAKGYDPQDANWFWAKYNPDGTLFKNKKDMKLAGRVAKGKPVGCIACHASAPGDNFVFRHGKAFNAAVVFVK